MLKGAGFISLLVVGATTALLAQAHAQLSPDRTRCVNERKQFLTEAAISGCTAVINFGRERGGNLAIAYNNRGLACQGRPRKGASTDLLRIIELKDDVYAMLFRYLARSRAGESGEAELEANVGRLKSKEWPYAVTELYLGKRSPAATLDAAGKSDDRCEAQFYIGQWHFVKGNKAEAEGPLKAAVETCPKTFIKYAAAVGELKRLKP